MTASNSSGKHFENIDQNGSIGEFSSNVSHQSVQFSSNRPPTRQPRQKLSSFFTHQTPPECLVPQPNYDNQSNFMGFLEQINFSIPPPFQQPTVQIPMSNASQVPYNQFCTAILPGISSNYLPERRNFCSKSYLNNDPLQIDKALLRLKKVDAPPPVQLYKFSDQLKNYHSGLRKLEDDVENLKSVRSQLDDVSWNNRVASLSSQRKALKKMKQEINVEPGFLTLLKYKIKKRRKKRKAKKKVKLPKEKSLSKYEIAHIHMQQLQQIADSQKQEQKFKMEADSILFSVRQKKSEAHGQIQLLSALSKLHMARISFFNSQNKHPSSDSVAGFKKILDKLKSMWEHQMKEYMVEENGLKVMLEDLATNVENEECTILKKTFGQWLKLMFGTTDLQKSSYFSTFSELIEIRNEWDKYVMEDANSSKIPAGWVVPKYREDDAWSKFIS